MIDDRSTALWRGIPLAATIGLVLAAVSLFLPAMGALAVSGGAVVLGIIGRRQVKRDPSTGPGWVSLAAIILGGFVFVSQAVILVIVYLPR